MAACVAANSQIVLIVLQYKNYHPYRRYSGTAMATLVSEPNAGTLSQEDALRRLADMKRHEAEFAMEQTLLQREQKTESSRFVTALVSALVMAVVIAGLFVMTREQGLYARYRSVVRWFETGYTKGPRPLGATNVSLRCLLTCVDYPNFASTFLSMQCRSLPQSAAIFLIRMIQTFGHQLEGVHYSGDAAQLGAEALPRYLKSYKEWDVPENRWRFLFPKEADYTRSVAVHKARARKGGDTMLHALYNGGLCALARQFADADVGGEELARELLDQQLVYYQACGAERAAQAYSTGSMVGSIVGSTIAVAGSAVAIMCALETAFSAGLLAPLCAIQALTFSIGCAVVSTVATIATTAAVTGIAYAATPCPFDVWYTLEREPDGRIVKKAWHGSPKGLPPLAHAK